mmetsp:Transcript_12796/g.19372  ORF Transcript_12796/g.19372 Transcript_12796/m.19372 type:complete len:667 (-) Transcript_12796:2448-4448(-)
MLLRHSRTACRTLLRRHIGAPSSAGPSSVNSVRCFSKKWRTEYNRPDKFDKLEEEFSQLEEDVDIFRYAQEADEDDVPLDLFEEEAEQTFMQSQRQDRAPPQQKVKVKPFALNDPWEITEDDVAKSLQYEDLIEWSPELVSATTRKRLVFFSSNVDGDDSRTVPTLDELAKIPLPLPRPPIPAEDSRSYSKYRKRIEQRLILTAVAELAEGRVAKILRMETAEEKQAAVDALFESIPLEMEEREGIMKGQPKFQEKVQKALNRYLISIKKQEKKRHALSEDGVDVDAADEASGDENEKIEIKEDDSLPLEVTEMEEYALGNADASAAPVFMDLKSVDKYFPVTGVSGRISEDWDLAADENSKRIMLREPMRRIAQHLVETDADGKPGNILISGKRGVGKSVALNAIVAAARQQGSIVLYLPNCEYLRKFGKYTEPSPSHPGMFDLPIHAMSLCKQLEEAHGEQLATLKLTKESIMNIIPEEYRSFNLQQLAQTGRDDVELSSAIYFSVVEELMNQTEFPFIVAFDEYNTLFDEPQHFHMDYMDAQKGIPHQNMTLFKPLLTMGFGSENSPMMRRGSVIASIDCTRPVKRDVTENAVEKIVNEGAIHVDITRYSFLELNHMLSNYEAIGVGRLRVYGAEVVENEAEVAFLRMKTGCIGANVLNGIII